MTKLQFHTILDIVGNSWATLTSLFAKLCVSPPHGGNWTRAISRLRKEFRDRGHAVCDEEVLSTNPSCTQAEIERLQVENASLKQIIQSKNHQGGDNHNVTSLFHLFGLPLPNFPLTFVKLPSEMKKSRQSEAVSVTLSLIRKLLSTICDDYKDLSSVVFSSSAFKASDMCVSPKEQSVLDHPSFQSLAAAINASLRFSFQT